MNELVCGPHLKALYLKVDVQGSHYRNTMSILPFKNENRLKG